MALSAPEPNYQRVYKSPAGGAVDVHPAHGEEEYADNLQIAHFLADRGEWVRLLPVNKSPGVHNPDAIIGNTYWEFKTNRKATVSAIDNEIRDAKRQASCILLHVKSGLPVARLEAAIHGRVSRSASIVRLRILLDNQLFEFTRKEITSQQFSLTLALRSPS